MPPAIAFALIAGYADAVGYLRFKAFAGMMTGNTVLMGLAVFHLTELALWEYAALLALFVAAAACSYMLLLRVPPAALLLAEAVLILLPDFFDARWTVTLLVIAMGLQNPVAARFGVSLNTTFITGVILRFAEGLARSIRAYWSPQRHEPFLIYGLVWLGYVVGAACGAAGQLWLSHPLFIPVALLAFVYGWSRYQYVG